MQLTETLGKPRGIAFFVDFLYSFDVLDLFWHEDKILADLISLMRKRLCCYQVSGVVNTNQLGMYFYPAPYNRLRTTVSCRLIERCVISAGKLYSLFL